ncbi:MAG: nicotinate phosphoribosyltransferase [Nitrospiraceae bacterium]|nr:nicotinate phosphoribosyltransferase [Nitrospiraceae bacterium]
MIECVRGNIANQPDMEAIVNAANAQLRSGGGVAGAIHRAAGPGLEEEGRALAPIRPGQAVITGAHGLPNRFVIHCLGPIFGQDKPEADLLASCYRHALQLADRHQIRSIAFPAISTGIFGYPLEGATRVALTAILEEAPTLSFVKHIRVVLFDEESLRVYEALLKQHVSLPQAAFRPSSGSQVLAEGARPAAHYDTNGNGLALFTDLYELTMLQAYMEEGMTGQAVFTLFVRRLPKRRNVLIACGVDTVLHLLETLRFREDDLKYLKSLALFSDRFLAWLRDFRFTGDVYAVPEGTPVFSNEPLLEVVAPMPEAQLIETLVMNQIHVQTVQASKAQRVVTAANGKPVVDFGARRMHGIDAALKAARAFWIGGVSSTSNVLAGKIYGVPVAGTMAHSFIQAHENEMAAFRAFARVFPETVLLVDTYDTLAGVRKVINLAHAMGDRFQVKAVRLDSGDLLTLSKEARRLLDDAGLQNVEIFASGGLNEEVIEHLLSSNAPIDGFGVGTSMGVSSDAPDLDIAYKLAEYAGKGRLKLSTGKPILPGRKQVFRIEEHGQDVRDVIACADEEPVGRPLLVPMMRGGTRLPAGSVDLDSARRYAQQQMGRLPEQVRAIAPADPPYPVEISPKLRGLQQRIIHELTGQPGENG